MNRKEQYAARSRHFVLKEHFLVNDKTCCIDTENVRYDDSGSGIV